MTQVVLYPHLPGEIETFIRTRRNFDGNSHQRKHMFNITCPFTDLEGLRFSTITNSPYDFLSYKPTPTHLFLQDGTLENFEHYVSKMFDPNDDYDDWCYFKMFKKLSPCGFENLTEIMKQGKFKRTRIQDDYKVPVCLIPVIEYYAMETFSQVYSVKAACASLEKTQIRVKINTYFYSLLRLLKCREEDIVELLVKYGVLPTREFRLLSTQKDLTMAFSLFKKSKLQADIGNAVISMESQGCLMIPKYGIGNQNLHQTLIHAFVGHPVYSLFRTCLNVETEIEDDGKGRLPNAIPNRKRKYTHNPRDQSKLPKKWRKQIVENESFPVCEQTLVYNGFEKDVDQNNSPTAMENTVQVYQTYDIVAESLKQSAFLFPNSTGTLVMFE